MIIPTEADIRRIVREELEAIAEEQRAARIVTTLTTSYPDAAAVLQGFLNDSHPEPEVG